MVFRSSLAFCVLTGALVPSECAGQNGPHAVTCKNVEIDTLHDPWSLGLYRKARVCYPDASDGSTFPLHLFAHGDVGGGAFFVPGYDGLQKQLASFGFVVPAYLSCWIDNECYNGETSFLEALKTIEYLERNPTVSPVDFSKRYSVSGHSTGARVAMMLAAVRDTPKYLSATKFAALVTESMRKILDKTAAFVGDHTDPMNDPKQNPDMSNYDISKSPVFLITGTKDTIEPVNSSWKNFQQISTLDKIHLNFNGDSHIEPNIGHHEGPFIAYFSRYHVLGDIEARDKIYGNNSDSLANSDRIAPAGATNNGDADISFLACSSEGLTIPQKLAAHCSSRIGQETSVVVV